MRISKTRTYPCLLVPYVVHQPTPVILLEEPSRRSQRPYEIHDALGYLWFISLGRVNVQHLLRVDQIAKAFVSSVVVGSASPTAEDVVLMRRLNVRERPIWSRLFITVCL